MNTKKIAVDYKFGFAPSEDRWNPLIVVEEWNDGVWVGDIRFHYENLDMMIHQLKGIHKHPDLLKGMDEEA